MQITHIQCELGVYYGTGDFQGVKATVKAHADVERGEDAVEAYGKLAQFVHAQLLEGARASDPLAVRHAIAKGGTAQIAAPKQEAAKTAETVEEKAKRTRRTKEQIAADEAAAKAAAAKKAGNGLLSDTEDGMTLGGLDKEDGLLGDAMNDEGLGAGEDDLLGGPEEIEVTRELLMEKLREVVKQKGSPALASLFKKVGSADLKSTPNGKYQELYAHALAALA